MRSLSMADLFEVLTCGIEYSVQGCIRLTVLIFQRRPFVDSLVSIYLKTLCLFGYHFVFPNSKSQELFDLRWEICSEISTKSLFDDKYSQLQVGVEHLANGQEPLGR